MRRITIVLGAALVVLTGCRSVEAPRLIPERSISLEERADMQTKFYASSYDSVFSATIAVLQDLGWQLASVDKPAGLIRATTARRLESLGPEDEKVLNAATRRDVVKQHADVSQKWSRWKELVIHTERWQDGRVRQRIVLNLRGILPAMSYSEKQGGGLFSQGRNVIINAPPVEQMVEVLIPEAYRDVQERIDKAVLQRQGSPSVAQPTAAVTK